MQSGTDTPTAGRLGENLLTALGYGVVLSVGACVLYLSAPVVLVYIVLGFGNPFAPEIVRYLPGIAVVGLFGSFTFPWYRNRTKSAGKWAVLGLSVIVVIVLGIFGTNAFNWMIEQWRWARGTM